MNVDVSKNTKKDRTQKVTENALPTQTPFPSSHINQILHVGSYPGYLSWFWISSKSVKNVGAVGVEILAFPLTWHIAYTTACNTVAIAQAVFHLFTLLVTTKDRLDENLDFKFHAHTKTKKNL